MYWLKFVLWFFQHFFFFTLQAINVAAAGENAVQTSEERAVRGKDLLDLISNIHTAIQGTCDLPVLLCFVEIFRFGYHIIEYHVHEWQ